MKNHLLGLAAVTAHDREVPFIDNSKEIVLNCAVVGRRETAV